MIGRLTARPTDVSAPTAASLSPGMRMLQFALLVEIGLAAFEGPLRYALYLLHADPLIFLRDALLLVGVVWVLLERSVERRLPAAVPIFVFLLAAHAAIGYLHLHSPAAVLYGVKLALPLLAGALMPELFFAPDRRVLKLIAWIWVATLVGASIDAYSSGDMPWVGVGVNLGGIDVELARDWQSGAIKRVGGFTRYSNSLAIMTTLMSVVLLGAVVRRWLRLVIVISTLVVLYWTTQKGAILGFGVVAVALAVSTPSRSAPLRLAIVAMTGLVVLAPTLFIHFSLPQSRGVFSLESFAERLTQMWPDAWRWIARYSSLAGVGLGGIGGAQRFYAPNDENAADNLFVFLYANCGVLSVVYLAGTALIAATARTRSRADVSALASVLFLLSYGVVVSLVEDQIAALWLGAAIAWLAATRQPAGARRGALVFPTPATELPR